LRLLYSLLASFANALMQIAALVHAKSRKWVVGRRHWRRDLTRWRKEHPGSVYWFHCASLGEFEQGRPVMERLRTERPDLILLLTFFSPSGFEARKKYAGAHGVFYLPMDTYSASNAFLEIVQPKVACFVKYEYWPNYFLACKSRGVALILISAILRPEHRYFGWAGFFWKPILQSVSHYFVQDEMSGKMLAGLGISAFTPAGDTRFDRVIEIASAAPEIGEIQAWCLQSRVLIGGSTWPADERVLHVWWQKAGADWKMLLVPHEIGEAHLSAMCRQWPDAVLWSQREMPEWKASRVLIIDEIGMLSTAYRYAHVAWIGGGFGAGIHNTLEAAAWNLPIVFGPRCEKFLEAQGLLALGAAKMARDEAEGVSILDEITSGAAKMTEMGAHAGRFVASGAGATEKIMSFLRAV
jgi:3-deoxy-D-manno-octulosonic-acid transferase